MSTEWNALPEVSHSVRNETHPINMSPTYRDIPHTSDDNQSISIRNLSSGSYTYGGDVNGRSSGNTPNRIGNSTYRRSNGMVENGVTSIPKERYCEHTNSVETLKNRLSWPQSSGFSGSHDNTEHTTVRSEGRASLVRRNSIERIKDEMFDMYVMRMPIQNGDHRCSCDTQLEPMTSGMKNAQRKACAESSTTITGEKCSPSCGRSSCAVNDHLCSSLKSVITRARFFFHSLANELQYGSTSIGSLSDPDEMTSQITGVSIGVVRRCTDLSPTETGETRSMRDRVSELCRKIVSGRISKKLTGRVKDKSVAESKYVCETSSPFFYRSPEKWGRDQEYDGTNESREPKKNDIAFHRQRSSRTQKNEQVLYGQLPRQYAKKLIKQDVSEFCVLNNNCDGIRKQRSVVWDTPRRYSERKSPKGILMVGSVCKRLRFVRKSTSGQSSPQMLDVVKIELEDTNDHEIE
ncbi:hypothetical protein DICVIV_06955 [Dictyocaulus viviparus]|uniref:Uncharacterized protein n=1 Tax=Dictyocaulus viviparus TaxID=29172 RepID=A0A0D8XT90_DICVI|nr:hypothetical protein DICVIV_06955 [Dictyocaulus viviparus]